MKKPLQTVMIVDDMAVNLSLIASILSDYYQVKVAKSGASALSLINQDPPDIILLDIVMPDMDGYDVCIELKSQLLTHAIPIIFVTTKNSIQDTRHGLTLGAVDFINKPINPALTLARVQTHLELKQLKEWSEQNQKHAVTHDNIANIVSAEELEFINQTFLSNPE
jgi:putative two-component system response regulator